MKKLLLAAALGLLIGCGGGSARGVSKAIEAYDMSAYPVAMQYFSEVDQERLSGKSRVRFFVYRGLTRFSLGDNAGAAQDLSMGQQMYEAGDRRWLSMVTVGQMNEALSKLGTGAPGAAPTTTAAPSSTFVGGTTAPTTTGGSQYLPPQPK